MHYSIVRRSLLLTALFVSGHGFYYLLIVVANAELNPIGFGRFYTGWVVLNVLVTPISIIMLQFSGYIARTYSDNDAQPLRTLLMCTAVAAWPWVAILVVLLETLFFLTATLIGADSLVLVVILPLTAASFLLVEFIRASFQGTLRFTAYGLSWLGSCATQCAFGATGLWVVGRPWACFAGMLIANLVTFACLLWLIFARNVESGLRTEDRKVSTYSLISILLFCGPFVGFVLFNNADVLLAYLALPPSALGTYTSSSVLPKAVITAGQPVAQIMLPIITSIRDQRSTQLAVWKAIIIAGILSTLGVIVLGKASGLVCGPLYGIRFCNARLMLILAAAAVPLSVLRILITADVARGRNLFPHFFSVVVVALVLVGGLLLKVRSLAAIDVSELASMYVIVCWGLLGVWGIAVAIREYVSRARGKSIGTFP